MSVILLPIAIIAKQPCLPQADVFYSAVTSQIAFGYYLLRRYTEVMAQLTPRNNKANRSNLISTRLYILFIPLAYLSVYLSLDLFMVIL